MSKRCKWTVYGIITAIIAMVILALIKLLFFSGLFVPLIELNGDRHMEVEVNTQFDDPGAKARFRFSDYSDQVIIDTNLNTTKLGDYVVRYTFEKYQKSVERTVSVVDRTAPVIKLNSGDTIRVFEHTKFEDPGCNAMDNYDGDVTAQVKVDLGALDMDKQGTYEVTYQVNDTSGNTTSLVRKVEVCKDPTATKVYYKDRKSVV